MTIFISYFVGALLGLLAIAPQIDYTIPMTVNSFHWLYLVVSSALVGFYLLHTRLNLSFKILVVYLFINCFVSFVPYYSCNAYILVVVSLLFYLLCQRCDFKIVLNMVVAAFLVQATFALFQLIGWDRLVNLNRVGKPLFVGTVMQYMRFSSLLAIMTPFLILKNKWYIVPILILCVLSQSSSFTLAVLGGIFVYCCLKFPKKYIIPAVMILILCALCYALYDWESSWYAEIHWGRLSIWPVVVQTWITDTFNAQPAYLHGPVSWKSIIFGRGLDTFMPLFPLLKHDPNPFGQVHNDWIQILWETGIIGFSVFLAYCINLLKQLYKRKEFILIAGLAVIGINMFFAFPMRITQTIWLMLAYLALCQVTIEKTPVTFGYEDNIYT